MELNYSIHSYSSYSPPYEPRYILQTSSFSLTNRWTSLRNYNEYLLLKLEVPAVVSSITFGKYQDLFPSNVKEVEVRVGMTPKCK
jgi:hypothetical protein